MSGLFLHKCFFTRQLFYLLTNFFMKYILDCSFSAQRFYYHQPENKFDFFFVSSSLCKGLRHEEISDRFLSVSPLLRYRGKTIESHCLDDDSALKKRNLFSRSIHSKDHTIVELLNSSSVSLLELKNLHTLKTISQPKLLLIPI